MASLDGDTSFDALLKQVVGDASGGGVLEGGARKRRPQLIPPAELNAPFSVEYLQKYDAKYFQEKHVKKLRVKLVQCREELAEADAQDKAAILTVQRYYKDYLEPFKNYLLDQLNGELELEEAKEQWEVVSKIVERFMRRTCAVAQNDKDENLHPVSDVRRRKLDAAVEAWRITLLNAPYGTLEGDTLDQRDEAWRQSFGDDALEEDMYPLPDPDDMTNRRPQPYTLWYEKQFAALCKRVHTTLIRAKKRVNHRGPRSGGSAPPRRGRGAAAPRDAVEAANKKWMGLVASLLRVRDLGFQSELQDFFTWNRASFRVADAHDRITFDPDAALDIDFVDRKLVLKVALDESEGGEGEGEPWQPPDGSDSRNASEGDTGDGASDNVDPLEMVPLDEIAGLVSDQDSLIDMGDGLIYVPGDVDVLDDAALSTGAATGDVEPLWDAGLGYDDVPHNYDYDSDSSRIETGPHFSSV